MATADLDFNLEIKGTPDEITAMLRIMIEYSGGKDGVYFSFTTANVGGQSFRISSPGSEAEKLLEAAANADSVKINASGPFGRYGELNDVDIFRDMAEAAPAAEFFGTISGFAGHADQSIRVRLADGNLKINTFYLSDDVRGDAEFDYFSTYLPYEKFIDIFGLDADEFDTEKYEELMGNEISCMENPGEFFEETSYEEFLDLLDADCSISEEEYEEIAEQFSEEDYEDFEEFLDNNDYAMCEEYNYDPIKKEYLGRKNRPLKSNTAYSANEEIREYLQTKGLPSDDAAINALSVEDVYAILAGTYGTDDEE